MTLITPTGTQTEEDVDRSTQAHLTIEKVKAGYTWRWSNGVAAPSISPTYEVAVWWALQEIHRSLVPLPYGREREGHNSPYGNMVNLQHLLKDARRELAVAQKTISRQRKQIAKSRPVFERLRRAGLAYKTNHWQKAEVQGPLHCALEVFTALYMKERS